jgi:hypothetical protein
MEGARREDQVVGKACVVVVAGPGLAFAAVSIPFPIQTNHKKE